MRHKSVSKKLLVRGKKNKNKKKKKKLKWDTKSKSKSYNDRNILGLLKGMPRKMT